jgi:hypothetical protein
MCPPAPHEASRPANALVAPAVAALLAAACAGPDAPWDVRRGDEGRFERASRECELLTRDAAGREGPISFDDCMGRRGFSRMGPVKRLIRGGSR